MPKDIRIGLTVEEQRRLTEYATVLRYPGPYEAIPLTEAKQAVKLAQRVQRKVRKLLENKPLF
jgi:HEPN domain-containing protein